MPTKRELLEGKTVENLKQMARDVDLSGYSNMRKDELVELINENYKKEDIQDWPEIGEEETEKEPEEETYTQVSGEESEETGWSAEGTEEEASAEPEEEIEEEGLGIESVESEGEEPDEVDTIEGVPIGDRKLGETSDEELEKEAETSRKVIIGSVITIIILAIIIIGYAIESAY